MKLLASFGKKIDSLVLKYETTSTTKFNYGASRGYRNSYLNRNQYTDHLICESEQYPGYSFDVVLMSKSYSDWGKIMAMHSDAPEDRDNQYFDLRPGDVIEISAKVKSADPLESTIYLNYAKLKDVVEFSDTVNEDDDE